MNRPATAVGIRRTLDHADRRHFCLVATGGALSVVGWLQSGAAWSQGAAVGKSLASKVGGSFLKGAAGKAGEIAVTQVAAFAGLDDGTAELSAKLDAIMAEVQAVRQELQDLRRYLEGALGQLSYDVNVKSVQPLIDTNESLMSRLSSALRSSNPAEADRIAQDAVRLLRGSYSVGLETWHNTLMGSSGQTGLLKAWAVAATSLSPLFGPTHLRGTPQAAIQNVPASIQKQWDYFDRQQALTANFLYYYLQYAGQPTAAQTAARTWMRNRRSQLGVLRGAASATDEFAGTNPPTSTPLAFLPPLTMVLRSEMLMYYMRATPAVGIAAATNNWGIESQEQLAATASAATGLSGWRTTSQAEFGAMRKVLDNGKPVAGEAYDSFRAALVRAGFRDLAQDTKLWLRPESASVIMLRDGQHWVKSGLVPPQDRAQVILVRNVPPDEAVRYFHL